LVHHDVFSDGTHENEPRPGLRRVSSGVRVSDIVRPDIEDDIGRFERAGNHRRLLDVMATEPRLH